METLSRVSGNYPKSPYCIKDTVNIENVSETRDSKVYVELHVTDTACLQKPVWYCE